MDLKSREGRREQGELIKAAATGAGLTLKELASRLGVSHALIYQYVSGANLAQPDKLQEIAHLTGVPVGYFFGESAAPAPPESTAPSTPTALPSEETAPLSTPATGIAPVSPPEGGGIDSNRVQGTLRQLEQLARAQDLPGRDLAGLLRTLEQMLGLARLAGEQRRQADILIRIGNARTDAGDLRGASEALEECQALFQELGIEERALNAAQSLARCRSLMGQREEAEDLFRQVAASPDPAVAWKGMVGLGQMMEQHDRYEEALAEYERAREVLEMLPASEASTRAMAEIYVRTNLANVYMAEGDFATALPLWQENLDCAEDLSQPDQFLEALLSEAVCRLYLGRPGAAYDVCKRATRLCRLLGDRERLAVSRACMAEVLAVAGLSEEGKEQAREASKLSSEIGTTRGVSFSNLALARSLILAGQAESARFYLDPEVGSSYPKVQAAALLLRSELWRRQGQLEQAESDARLALQQLEDLGALHLEKAGWTILGQVAVLRRDLNTLEEAITRATGLDRFTPGLAETPWSLEAIQGDQLRLRGDLGGAIDHYRKAVDIIQALRVDLIAYGVLETALDDEEKVEVYRRAIAAARALGRSELVDAIITEAGWPPLTEAEDAGGIISQGEPGGQDNSQR